MYWSHEAKKTWCGLLFLFLIPVNGVADNQPDNREGVMEEAVHYYGMDQSFKVVEYGQVSIDQALKVVDERFARLRPKYETGEEAIAETMFGFYREKDTFIEICINGPTEISFKFEVPRSKRFLIFQSVYQKETTLKSKGELIERIKAFFNLTPEAYKSYLAGHGG